MVRDFLHSERDETCQADVVVVGAGLVGLVLAHALSREGQRVVVVESGARSQVHEFHELNEVELSGHGYKGALHGRYRCLGGTSTRWGGALLPFQSEDLGSNLPGWPKWPLSIDDISGYQGDVEALFSLPAGSYEADAAVISPPAGLPSFTPRSAKWPRFARRNVARVVRGMLDRDGPALVWLNATVTEITTDKNRCLGVVARDSATGTRRLTVTAPATVLAAGAIETTRLMLLTRIERDSLWRDLPIGQGFNDHISAPVADLAPLDRSRLIRTFGFRFQKGGMRNWRLELKGDVRARQQLPGAFAHVAFTRSEEGAFGAVRSLLQSVQRREIPRFETVYPILRELPWFARAAMTRLTTGAVLPPDAAGFELHLVTEQSPIGDNRIQLSETRRDMFGKPLAHIRWSVSADDFDRFFELRTRLIDEWQNSALIQFARPIPRETDAIRTSLVLGGGVYHPAGSTRMGTSAADSVLDRNLAPHGTIGIWALSTAAFPTCGSANPSLTLLVLGLRLARHLVHGLRKGTYP